MGYALLGKLVWRGGRWYLRRRYPRTGHRLKLAAAGATAIAVLAIGASRRSGSGS